jgi:serine O-acetyltransferase
MPADDLEAQRPSATVPDWSREAKSAFTWSPARSLLASIRSYQRAQRAWPPRRLLVQKLAVLRHRIWSVATGADIPLNSRIAGGLLLPHPNGVVVHPQSEIGPNCLLFQQVTLGTVHGSNAVPRLGGNVVVGAGAKLLGGITIGDHALIGANAVVLQDVPAGASAVGVPARIILPKPGVVAAD